MKYTSILVAIFIAFVMSRCGNEVDSRSTQQEIFTLALIDLSKSRDSASIQSSIRKMQAIFLKQPEDVQSTFIVRVIDSDFSVGDLFNITFEPSLDQRISEKKKYEQDRINRSLELEQNVWDYYKKRAMQKPSSEQTCICNSLLNSIEDLSKAHENKYTVQLLVFSDMFEECKKSSSLFEENFSMCSGESEVSSSLEKLLEIIKTKTPNKNLQQLVKAKNLYFIMDESDLYNEFATKCLNPSEVREIWNEFLFELGYSRKELGQIHFSKNVPDHLLKTEAE